MIDALIAGRLYGQPAERTSKNGKRFATAKVRVPTRDGDALFVNVISFSASTITALLSSADGDSVALSGELTPKVWTDKDGNARPSLDLLAHAVLSAYDIKRRRKASSKQQSANAEATAHTAGADQDLDDEAPF